MGQPVYRLPKGFSQAVLIGEGAFSEVYRAKHNALERFVAVKVLREADPKLRQEHLSEARTLAGIKIDCVPEVFDAFEWKGQICIVMEWVKGVSLSSLFKEKLSPGFSLQLADTLIHAVASLHQKGYAHRDIKPDNILVSATGKIYLVDFGFSKNAKSAVMSAVGQLKGTPAYMAPELLLGGNIDYLRADLFSLGKVLTPLLGGTSRLGLVDQLLSDNPNSRLPKGDTLLQHWQNPELSIDNMNVHEFVAELASRQLAERLFTAALNLIRNHPKGYGDAAYAFLVECLNENGNHPEALHWVETFSEWGAPKKISRVQYSLAALLLLAISLTFWWTLFSNEKPEQVSQNFKDIHPVSNEKKHLLAGTKRSKTFETSSKTAVLPLRPELKTSHRLSGILYIDSLPVSGTLYHGNHLVLDATVRKGLEMPYGIQILSWRDKDGEVVWKETIKILPFQLKKISLPSQLYLEDT